MVNAVRAVIGIDPGKTGAAVLITEDRRIFFMRFTKKSGETEAQRMARMNKVMADWKSQFDILVGYVEQVGTRPGQGGKSKFTFGGEFKLAKALLAMHGIAEKNVIPQTWQLYLSLGGRYGTYEITDAQCQALRKKAHQKKAQQLFPNLIVTLDLCDAILIAEYAWRKQFASILEGV